MKKVMKKIMKICLQFYSVKNQEIGQSKIVKKKVKLNEGKISKANKFFKLATLAK